MEEVARIVGYDSIPTEMLSTAIPHHEGQELRAFRERVRDILVWQGLNETISYSAVGLDVLQKARITDDDAGLLAVATPMSRDFKYMRPTLRASLLNTLSYNAARDARSVAIFEIGRVYLKRNDDLPHEPEIAAGLLHGQRTGEGWLSAPANYDFYDAKGIVESLLIRLGAQAEFSPHADDFLHPGKAASVSVNGAEVGALGEVHPLVAEAFELDGPVVFFEINVSRLFEALPQSPRVRQTPRPLPRLPPRHLHSGRTRRPRRPHPANNRRSAPRGTRRPLRCLRRRRSPAGPGLPRATASTSAPPTAPCPPAT